MAFRRLEQGRLAARQIFFEGFEDGGLRVERSTAWLLGSCVSEAFKFFEYTDSVFAVGL